MIGSLLLLLAIDGTLCPVGPGPDAGDSAPLDRGGSRLVSRGSAGGARPTGGPRPARLGHRLAGQRQSAAGSGAGLPTLPVVPFHRPRRRSDRLEVVPAVPGSCRASRVPRPIGRLPGSTTTFTPLPTRGRRGGGSLPSCSRPTPAVGSSTGRSARCSRLRAALSAGGRKPAEGLAERTPAAGTLSCESPAAKSKASPTAVARVSGARSRPAIAGFGVILVIPPLTGLPVEVYGLVAMEAAPGRCLNFASSATVARAAWAPVEHRFLSRQHQQPGAPFPST